MATTLRGEGGTRARFQEHLRRVGEHVDDDAVDARRLESNARERKARARPSRSPSLPFVADADRAARDDVRVYERVRRRAHARGAASLPTSSSAQAGHNPRPAAQVRQERGLFSMSETANPRSTGAAAFRVRLGTRGRQKSRALRGFKLEFKRPVNAWL